MSSLHRQSSSSQERIDTLTNGHTPPVPPRRPRESGENHQDQQQPPPLPPRKSKICKNSIGPPIPPKPNVNAQESNATSFGFSLPTFLGGRGSNEAKRHSLTQVGKLGVDDSGKGSGKQVIEIVYDEKPPELPERKPNNKNSPVLTIKVPLVLKRFDTWFETRHPRIGQYKKAIYVCFVLLLLGLIIIIICATTRRLGPGDSAGGSSGDVGTPGLQLSGTGDGTYYDPGIGTGACGVLNTGDQFVAALNAPQFGQYANPANSPVCGACIRITGPKGVVEVKIMDKCPVCKSGDVDLAPAAFDKIADETQGRVPISWTGC